MTHVLLFYNARLLDEAIDTPGALLVIDDKIRAVYSGYFTNKKTIETIAHSVLIEDGYSNCAIEYYDALGYTLMPAFIDMHVHVRYHGQTRKEDLESDLRAAAAGGFGTVVAMPDTVPVVSSLASALEIDKAAYEFGLINVIQSVSITKDFSGNDTNHLDELDSVRTPLITEDEHAVASSAVLLNAMHKAAERGIIVSCRSEDGSLAKEAKRYRDEALVLMKEYHLSTWGSVDDETDNVDDDILDRIAMLLTQANDLLALAENTATVRNIMLAREARCHIHVMHVSTANALDAVRTAKEAIAAEMAEHLADDADDALDALLDGKQFAPADRNGISLRVTCGVTPYHLALCGTDEPFIRALVNPPLRSEDDRIVLLEGLRDGTIDVIATDHAPHTLEDKIDGAYGFTGLETAYAVCNTILVQHGQLDAKRLSQLMSANPARILCLNKGVLAPGYDADIVFVDPDEKIIINTQQFFSKGKATPFDGMEFTGSIKQLFVGGRKIY